MGPLVLVRQPAAKRWLAAMLACLRCTRVCSPSAIPCIAMPMLFVLVYTWRTPGDASTRSGLAASASRALMYPRGSPWTALDQKLTHNLHPAACMKLRPALPRWRGCTAKGTTAVCAAHSGRAAEQAGTGHQTPAAAGGQLMKPRLGRCDKAARWHGRNRLVLCCIKQARPPRSSQLNALSSSCLITLRNCQQRDL